MDFSDLDLKFKYRSNEDDIVSDFYFPLLSHSVLYKRAVGFFTSSSLLELSKGLSKLLERNGKVLLITSPKLSQEDIKAIEIGYENRNSIIENALLRELTLPKNYFEEERLNYIASLIALNNLDIKIAFIKNNEQNAMFHEKIGIVYDNNGNKVAFTGSLNETYNAFHENFESIDVFFSWIYRDELRIKEKEKDFDLLWNNNTKNVEVFDFPKIVKSKLLMYKKENLITENKDMYYNCNHIPSIPKHLKLYNYQEEAINNWMNSGYCGIFSMATGSGKTFTAIAGMIKLLHILEYKLAIFIVCPYQHLVEQWVQELKLFNISPIIAYSNPKYKSWKDDLKLKVRNYNFESINNFFFITTNMTYSSDFVQENIRKIRKDILLIVDEVHNFGSNKLSGCLNKKIKYRLGLTATFERHYDINGTKRLLDYFKKILIDYTLKDAIDDGKLTQYYYYPILCYFNQDELDEYNVLTAKIKNIYKNIHIDSENEIDLPEHLKLLLIKRSRLVGVARDKIRRLTDIISQINDLKHCLVYCGSSSLYSEDIEMSDDTLSKQIKKVVNVLGKDLKLHVAMFTSNEDMETRKVLLSEFVKADPLQILVAMKCLDEGVNIPEIEYAFILASSTNKKEYIQRRGRVLRKYKGKKYSYIYDFLTLPYDFSTIDQQVGIIDNS